MRDDALGLADTLFGLLYNVVWCLIGKADNDRSLGDGGHGRSSEQGGQDGEGSEAHAERRLVCVGDRASCVLVSA